MKMNEEKVEVQTLAKNWPKVMYHLHLHVAAVYGIFLLVSSAKWTTVSFFFLQVFFGMIGITLGCHRLWAHRTFQAPWPVRLFLAAGHTLACEGSILNWAVSHRLHHKHHGTHLDPYNYKRGFLFSHYSSKCLDENPAQEEAKKSIDIKDLETDEVVYYQNIFYWPIVILFGALLPVNAGVEYWGESILVSIFVLGFLRVVVLQNLSRLTHSGYIIWGLDPLDKRSSDTWLVFFFSKSLWPQYHYLLPWDYRSGEFGTYDAGCNTAVLRVLAALKLVSGLTTITSQGVKQAMAKAAETGIPLVKCLEDSKYIVTDIISQDNPLPS